MVCRASCPRSASVHWPRLDRRTRFRTSRPPWRRSSLVARRSCRSTGGVDGAPGRVSVISLLLENAADFCCDSTLLAPTREKWRHAYRLAAAGPRSVGGHRLGPNDLGQV